ncbi:hypothetical protein [Agrobacterium tumefaciens]|uniref:hypothetical protein n=1 Tax=Agrobacterium tumefaciens TaxID=358 RepID=UPI003B9EE805
MQSEKQIEAAARAICAAKGLNPDCLHQINVFDGKEHFDSEDDRGRRYVIGWRLQEKFARAALEAALSAAEPVACEYGHDNGDGTYSPTYARWPLPPHIKPHGDMPVNLFYAAPPAPSVAVKELPYHCDVCTVPGYGDAPCSPLCDRSALSAQVQDVADVPQSPWPASDWAIGRIKELEAQAAPEGWQLVPTKPTKAMAYAAACAHYGKKRVDQTGIEGISMTVNNIDYNFATAFCKFWKGALSAAPVKQEGGQ